MGIYPYEYMDSFDRFNEHVLPPKDSFASSIDGYEGITDKEYQRVFDVCREFNITNLGQYSDLYLKIGVMLLADLFGTFRDTSMKVNTLDQCNYVSLPSMAWNALLLMTNTQPDNITEVDTYNFIKRGMYMWRTVNTLFVSICYSKK